MAGQDVVRSGATTVLVLVAEVVVGIWLLFLFAVAVAWAPLDRRLGFHARRRAERYGGPEPADDRTPAVAGAYGIGVARSVDDQEEDTSVGRRPVPARRAAGPLAQA
ncbi:MAG: hypothetical protein ACRDI2_17160 [Chloroflexota bacterium]